ncbi:MAG TPA: hypothetical protein V6D10_23070 [Trichocoleus sp.]|jgi:hypothetical protein
MSRHRLWLISAVSLVGLLLPALPGSSHITSGQSSQSQDGHSPDHASEQVAPLAAPLSAKPVPLASIEMETEPPLSQVVPAHDSVKLKLKAVDANQRPLTNAQWQLTLLAPSKTPWFSSDFPIVEGTTLVDTQAIAVGDGIELKTILPIRGDYQLKASVTPAGSAAPLTQTFVLHVPENPIKYRNTAILVAILLGVGFAGGWVIASQSQTRSAEIAPQPVRLLLSGATIAAILSLLVVNLSAELADHHHADEMPVESAAKAQSGNLKLEYVGDTAATVGQTARVAARVIDTATRQPIRDAVFQLEAVALEHGESVLSYEGKSDRNGLFTWDQQFFDGAPHALQIQAIVNPDLPPLKLTQTLDVAGISPPLLVRLVTLGYMTAILALGMALGFGLQRRQLTAQHSLVEAGSRN